MACWIRTILSMPEEEKAWFDNYGRRATLVARNGPGCVFQLKANLKKEGKKFRVVHTAQLCAEAGEKNQD